MTTALTLDRLKQAVETDAALRCRRILQPAGGPGDKVFPPTYEKGTYAKEDRVINKEKLPCVILDSVQSQANRMELALLQATRSKKEEKYKKDEKIKLPIVEVDFAEAGLPEVGIISSLETPHRIADAILRDSNLEGIPFPESCLGQRWIQSIPANATGLYEMCPTGLVFGLWFNPTGGPGNKGNRGTKFQRILTSEIVAVNIAFGSRGSIQADAVGIAKGTEIFRHKKTGTWSLEEQKGKDWEKIDPSKINHGAVPAPFSVEDHGGITMDYALQTVVISLPALRRLHFPLAEQNTPPDLEARTVLAALGLCGAVLSIEQGCDLRSRCLLIPESGEWELPSHLLLMVRVPRVFSLRRFKKLRVPIFPG
jgi:CRISPR-associated protein Csb1